MLEKLNTPGGHIIVFFSMILTGIIMGMFHLPHADDIAFGSFTALLGMLAPKAIDTLTKLRSDPNQITTTDLTVHSEKSIPADSDPKAT